MFDVFIGQHENKIDGKGRLSIPADFRKVIQAGHKGRDEDEPPAFLLIFGDERTDYLECVTMERLKKYVKKIRRMDKRNPKRKQLEETIFAKSQKMVLDDTGRIVLPPKGRDKLGLSANDIVRFVGSMDTFRLWNPDAHEAHSARPEAQPEIGYDPNVDPMEYLDGDDDDDWDDED